MKNIGSSALIAGLLVANVAVADPVAVKDGAVFVAGNVTWLQRLYQLPQQLMS